MERYIMTMSEIKAYQIMTKGNIAVSTEVTPDEIREKADELILLAEKIKAERLSSAMQSKTLGE